MDYTENTNGPRDEAYARRAEKHDGGTPFIADEADASLLRLAKIKLAEKARLWRFAITVLAVTVSYWMVFAFFAGMFGDTAESLALASLLYSVGAMCAIVHKFIMYHIRNNRRVSRGYTVTPLMREYDKLRRLPAEALRDEMRLLEKEAEE